MNVLVIEGLQVAGFYRLKVHRGSELREDTGWFKNVITDQGMTWIGQLPIPPNPNLSDSLNTHVGVGTGTATPSFADTRLATPLAMFPTTGPSGVLGGVLSYTAGVTPYWSCIFTYQFALGAVVGNISEVGVGQASITDTDPLLFSRCLILDALGNPTVISVTALDVLTVTYELRYYIATGDNTYSMVISGTLGPVIYTGTYRRMKIGTVPLLYYPLLTPAHFALSLTYENFALGPITGQPTFTNQAGNTSFGYSSTAYIIGSGYVEFTTSMGLNISNFAAGITGFSTSCNHGQYQFSISPFIPKTNAYTLSITWRVYWIRYP